MSQCSEVATRQDMEYFITDIRTTKVERIVKPKAFVGLGDVNHQNRRCHYRAASSAILSRRCQESPDPCEGPAFAYKLSKDGHDSPLSKHTEVTLQSNSGLTTDITWRNWQQQQNQHVRCECRSGFSFLLPSSGCRKKNKFNQNGHVRTTGA
jgi:hypothetical protein